MTLTGLVSLEKSGEYLFHGSPRKLQRLEPRQQMTYSHNKKRLVKDGKPAVCATPFLKVAIFRSLVYKDFNSFGVTNGRITLRASPKAMSLAKQAHGYIYVLPRSKFRKHSPMEWRAYHAVRPITSVAVSYRNLPKGVRIIKNYDKWRKQFNQRHNNVRLPESKSAGLSSQEETGRTTNCLRARNLRRFHLVTRR